MPDDPKTNYTSPPHPGNNHPQHGTQSQTGIMFQFVLVGFLPTDNGHSCEHHSFECDKCSWQEQSHPIPNLRWWIWPLWCVLHSSRICHGNWWSEAQWSMLEFKRWCSWVMRIQVSVPCSTMIVVMPLHNCTTLGQVGNFFVLLRTAQMRNTAINYIWLIWNYD